ncbi:MAG: glycosyltransferase family 2 protein [Bacillota bacterium]
MIISIITPTYNSEKTIRLNIESVLRQDFDDFEHIIVDNLSNDSTLEIIRDMYQKAGKQLKLRIISEKDQGISDAFNKGIAFSRGQVIGILNSDDFYFDDTVLKKTAIAFMNKDVLFTHGDVYFEDSVHGSNIRRPLLCPAEIAMPYNHPTMFFRREVYEKYGVFDLNFRYAMDYELVMRFEISEPGFQQKSFYIKGDPLVHVKSGGESWQNEDKAISEIKSALKKNGLWNYNSRKSYYLRKTRNNVKKVLDKLGLQILVKYWRNWKWKNG